MLKQYLRKENGEKVGLMVAYPDGNGKVKIGFSKCHPRLDSFNKQMAHDLAVGRAERYDDNLTNEVNIPRANIEDLLHFANRCKRYYKDKALPEWSQIITDNM